MARKTRLKLNPRWLSNIGACEQIVLDATEDSGEDSDLIDPEDSGISLPIDKNEGIDAEEIYDSVIAKDVTYHTLADLR